MALDTQWLIISKSQLILKGKTLLSAVKNAI